MYWTVLYCTVLHCTALHYMALYFTVMDCTILYDLSLNIDKGLHIYYEILFEAFLNLHSSFVSLRILLLLTLPFNYCFDDIIDKNYIQDQNQEEE